MIDIADEINVERISPDDGHYFFGYYDLSPESPNGKYVLANRVGFIDRVPNMSDPLEVGYFEIGKKNYNKIGITYAWNYQEGCRLQWIDNRHIIYNDRSEKGFCSKVFDIETNKIVKKYDYPVYSISRKKNIATSYGFINNKYSYAHTKEESLRDSFGDGVYILDLYTGNYKLILPVDKLAEASSSQKYHNWVEYCTISPDGNKFFLLHRWDNNGELLGNQLCVCDINGTAKVLLRSKFISHTGWRGNDSVSSWARITGGFNRIQNNQILEKTGLFKMAKNIYHLIVKKPALRQKFTNDAYILFDLKTNNQVKIQNADLTSDGHCTWSLNKRFMLTDTYANSKHNRSLILYDSLNDVALLLGEFYAIPSEIKDYSWEDSPMRCDLHPKWSFDEKHIYFDSVHEGFRGLYRINISQILEKKR